MKKNLRIIPLSGQGEIGRNMIGIEYGHNLLVIDCGVMFPESDMPGVDVVIPDFDILRQNRHRLLGVVLTHGHMDHIGALPYLLRDIQTPVYGTPLALGLAASELQEHGLVEAADLRDLPMEGVRLGDFTVYPFHVTHSIPEALGLVIKTPVGTIVHTGDYKLDPTPVSGEPTDFARLAELTRKGVLVMLGDSTNADKPGSTPSEQVVAETLDQIFREAKGRIVVSTFASQLSRVQQVFVLAGRYHRPVGVAGRSMAENVRLARELGYLPQAADRIVDLEADGTAAQPRLVVLATGSQGEPASALGRMSDGRLRQFAIGPGDTVVLSSHAIPGNEEMVGRMINRLFDRGANVIYDRLAQVHVSGHGSRDDLRAMLEAVRPRYFIPIHGEARHLHLHGQLAVQSGLVSAENVFILNNGQPWTFDGQTASVGQAVPARRILVDGSGDVGELLLAERTRLGEDGFIVVMVPLDRQGRLAGEPKFISRGFVQLDESGTLLDNARAEVKRLVKGKERVSPERVRDGLRDFLYRETRRRPMVLPSLISV